MNKKTPDNRVAVLKVIIVASLLAICLWSTYYFHYVLRNDVLYTHFFYVPIVLACIWWDWKGLAIAVVLATTLIITHFTSGIGTPVTNDLTRTVVFFAIGAIVAFLTVRRKEAEKALKISEQRYRSLFEDSPISLWENDWSEVKKYLDHLKARRVTNFKRYFKNHPDEIIKCLNMLKVTDVNRASLDLYKASSKKDLLGGLDKIFSEESYEVFKSELVAAAEGRTLLEHEAVNKTLSGEKRNITLRWSVAPGYEKTLSKVLVSIVDITDRKQAEDTIRWLAYRDILTGLPNRMLFNDRLAVALYHAERHQGKLALMILDLDKFKDINDTLGHSIGDKLLKSVGDRLTNLLRKGDTVARMGGDEFMILLSQIEQVEDTTKIAQKILGTFQKTFLIDDHELNVTTSIGIAIYPSDGEDVDTLMKEADIAMYAVKRSGRNNYKHYTPDMALHPTK